jgi:hypothetical protein
MKISKKLEWMRPYVTEGLKHVPKGKAVTRLWTFKLGGRYGKHETAAIITNDFKEYRIYLHTMRHPRGQPPSQFSKIDMIKYLAHEMAHMKDMDHTPRHSRLEGKLQAIFSAMLEKEGYVSEEEELSQ